MNASKSLSLALGALLSAAPAVAQVNLSRMAFLGDSEGAAFTNNCLLKVMQTDSVPAIIARAAGVTDFQQPIIDPGAGTCVTLSRLVPLTTGSKAFNGVPTNLTLNRPYNNLSIGGCAIGDMLKARYAAETRGGACAQFIPLVLRNNPADATPDLSMVDQAAALSPTFVFLENVGNDYLGAVLSGTAIDGVTVTPLASFQADYKAALTKLKAAQTAGVVFGVADVTNIPFATTLPPVVLNPATSTPVIVNGAPIPLLGPRDPSDPTKPCPGGAPACPVPLSQTIGGVQVPTLITLNASAFMSSGFGIPCAVFPANAQPPNCNKPLPDSANPTLGLPGVILYPNEVALLKQRAAEYDAAVKAETAAAGYKFYDTNGFLTRLKAGFSIGGMTVNAAFVTGGAFSLDGFHLTSLGYAILADDIIVFLNNQFGATIPRVPLAPYFFSTNTSGGLPFLTGSGVLELARQVFTPEVAAEIGGFIAPISTPDAVIDPIGSEPTSDQ